MSEYPKFVECDKCQKNIFVFYSQNKQKEYACNSEDRKDWHKGCYPLSYSPIEETKPEPQPTKEEKVEVSPSLYTLPKTGTLRVARTNYYQTIELTFEVEEFDLIKAARDTFRAIGILIDEETESK